jgi:hypothetical protein
MSSTNDHSAPKPAHTFFGNIYIFHAFDIGDDINLDKVQRLRTIKEVPLRRPKYFKNYHTPLAIELPHPNESARCISCKINNFGAVSLTYQIPFVDTLESIRKEFDAITDEYQEQSVIDARSVYKRIARYANKPFFFQMRSSYSVIQVNPQPDTIDIPTLKSEYGSVIASTLRFETETLAEYQRNEILESAIGYFRGDVIIVDTDVSFVYDDEYTETLDLMEFANIQQLELRFFDRLLDQRLNKIYEGEGRKLPLRSYIPFLSSLNSDPIVELGKLKVDISVIAERLEGSVKLAGEPYYSDIYSVLVEKLDLKNWQHAIDRKLSIIHDLQTTYQHKIDVMREDLLSVLIIVLIFIELVIGILSYLK